LFIAILKSKKALELIIIAKNIWISIIEVSPAKVIVLLGKEATIR